VAQLNIPMVGVDASLVLVYRDEYTKTLGKTRGDFHVLAVHEWLETVPSDVWQAASQKAGVSEPSAQTSGQNSAQTSAQPFALLSHCTEKTALPASEKQWQGLFAKVNQPVDIVAVGCCGMAGTYGHEADQKEKSLAIYGLSWEQAIKRYPADAVLATGYSCRSQVARIEQFKPKHPLQGLLACVSSPH
jgi:Fe-S oxidoreductase